MQHTKFVCKICGKILHTEKEEVIFVNVWSSKLRGPDSFSPCCMDCYTEWHKCSEEAAKRIQLRKANQNMREGFTDAGNDD